MQRTGELAWPHYDSYIIKEEVAICSSANNVSSSVTPVQAYCSQSNNGN